MAVGMWGRDYSFQKNTDILSVRQNLRLMVDAGQVVPYIDDSSDLGPRRPRLGGRMALRRRREGQRRPRLGRRQRADGALPGPPLKDAGAVRAMQLDINLRWADFQYFPNHDGNPDTSKLYEDFLQGPNKFFVNSTKDFMAVYLR